MLICLRGLHKRNHGSFFSLSQIVIYLYKNFLDDFLEESLGRLGIAVFLQAVVKPRTIADDLGGKAVTVIRICAHLAILPKPRC
jgi:hypothetical protein